MYDGPLAIVALALGMALKEVLGVLLLWRVVDRVEAAGLFDVPVDYLTVGELMNCILL